MKREKKSTIQRTPPRVTTPPNTSVTDDTTAAGDLYSIGYISFGSMNDTVKAIHDRRLRSND